MSKVMAAILRAKVRRAIDGFIHSELLFLKLPILFLSPGLKRRTEFADQDEVEAPEKLAAAA